MERYFNYSTDCNPRSDANIPRTELLSGSEEGAKAACRKFCEEEGIEFSEAMVSEVTDLVTE